MKFFTLATAGMVSESGGGVLFGFVVTPGMLLTVIGRLTGGGFPSVVRVPDAAAVVMRTVPVLAPGGRPAVCVTACSVWPPGGTMPLDGVTVIQGAVGVAVKLSPANSAAMVSVY